MGPAFGIWYKTAGAEGEEPTPELKELMDLFDEYKVTVDPDKQLEIAKEIVRNTTTELNVIQTAGMAPGPVVVKDNFHNVNSSHTADWLVMTPGTMDPCHFWIEQ
jgi:peptide/nickel transport system substrate-binding protein